MAGTDKTNGANSNGNSSTALAVRTDFHPLMRNPDEVYAMIEAYRENMDEGLNVFDLGALRIPNGTSTVWSIPNLETGEDETVKEIEAVVLYHRKVRQFYATEFDGGSAPPDCASLDGHFGVGSPGGSCAACPYSQFGSDRNGRGCACQERTWVLLLTEYSAAPMLLNLPPTANKPWKQFRLALSSKGQALSKVTIAIGLEKAKNAGGIEFVLPRFRLSGLVPPEKLGIVDTYQKALRSLVARAALSTPPCETGVPGESMPAEFAEAFGQ